MALQEISYDLLENVTLPTVCMGFRIINFVHMNACMLGKMDWLCCVNLCMYHGSNKHIAKTLIVNAIGLLLCYTVVTIPLPLYSTTTMPIVHVTNMYIYC